MKMPTLYKLLSILLTMVMVLNLGFTTVFAVDIPNETLVLPECFCLLENGSTIHVERDCPFYGLEVSVSKERSAEVVPQGVTVKKKGDYVWDIFANGNPIIIAQKERNDKYSYIYIDENENGKVDEGEEPLELPGVYEDPKFGFGYFLINSRIYGGCETADLEGDTSVTLDGGVVWQIFGGNRTSGTVNGDTKVTLNDGTVQYVYGGGAGYSDTDAAYVTGTSHVALNGGNVVSNIYGGGGWRGATVGNSNVTVTGGEVWNVFGGGENASAVTNTANIVIDCDDNNIKGGVYGGGAGFNNTNATVANVDIQMVSGYVPQITGGGAGFMNEGENNFTSSTTSNAAIKMEGGSTDYIFSKSNDVSDVDAVSIRLAGGTVKQRCSLTSDMSSTEPTGDVSIYASGNMSFAQDVFISINQPVEGALVIDIDGSYTPVILDKDSLNEATSSKLTYRNIGSAEGTWASFKENSIIETKGSNPYLTWSGVNSGKFDEIVFENSYVDFHDTGISNKPAGFDTITKKLTLDGGAMRVFFAIDTLFPETEFKNNPLLYYGHHIRGAGYNTSYMKFTSATGTAKVQLMARSGDPEADPLNGANVSQSGFGCVVAPTDTPDGVFLLQNNAITQEKCYWGTTTYQSSSEIGKRWQVLDGSSCRCWVGSAMLERTVFQMAADSGTTAFTLKDLREGDVLDENTPGCPLFDHQNEKTRTISYALSDGTTAPGARIEGNQLSVNGAGYVNVAVTAEIGNKTNTNEVKVYIVEHPTENYFFNINEGHPENKDIVLTYKATEVQLFAVHNATNKRPSTADDSGFAWLAGDEHTETHTADTLTLTIKKEYLEKLVATGLKEYEFETVLIVDRFNTYAYDTFKIKVSDKNQAVLTLTPDKTEGLVYGDKVTYNASVAKENSEDIGELTGTVQFQVDGTNYGEPLALTAASITLDHTKLNANNHTITATYSGDANYMEDVASVITIVKKAPITIKASLSKTNITVGEQLPTPGLVYDGLIGSDSLTPAAVASFSGMPIDSNTIETYNITWNNPMEIQTEIEALPAYANYKATYTDTITLTIKNQSSTSSGSNVTVTPSGKDMPNPPIQAEVKVNGKVDKKGNATADITQKNINDAIVKAKTKAKKNGTQANGIDLVLNVVTGNKAVNNITVKFPNSVQKKIITDKIISTVVVVDNPNIKISMDLKAITKINKQAQSDVRLTIARLDSKKLTGKAKTAINRGPVFDLKVNYGKGKSVSSFGAGRVTVTIPYTLKGSEKAGNVHGVYVDINGKVQWITSSSYDVAAKALRFVTSHFSIYGVGHKPDKSKLNDTADHWAKADIEFVVARGLLSGKSTTTFGPNSAITREMFVTALGKLAGIDKNKYKTGKFTDVKADANYAPYVNWAVSKGITNGTTATTFSPDQPVNRQEMAVFMKNYAKAMDYTIPKTRVAITFTDNADIAAWATEAIKDMQMAGVIMGKDNNKYDPTGIATRAQVSAVLHRYVELLIDRSTAQGHDVNDSGQIVYYENGKLFTGSKTINGATYHFGSDGICTKIDAVVPDNKKRIIPNV